MIIVSGRIRVEEGSCESYLSDATELIELARAAPGCIDFHLAADPIEPDRINVYEQWDSVAAVEAFRGSGPSPGQRAAIREAQVVQYEVTSSSQL